MSTITITRKIQQEQEIALTLPYYAYVARNEAGCGKWFAITGDTKNLTVTHYEFIPPLISSADASELPTDALQCSESVFMQAYERAMLAITEKFLASCPNASAPSLSISEPALIG